MINEDETLQIRLQEKLKQVAQEDWANLEKSDWLIRLAEDLSGISSKSNQ